VCGDDGKTYSNERALRITACKEDKQVDVSYKGECKRPCAGFVCAGFSQVCVPSEDNTEAKCTCPNCDHREDEPVCGLVGSRQLTFKNKCELDRKACLVNKKPFLLSESACGGIVFSCVLFFLFSKAY
ncbi:hypothetical protein LOTGIDRAFT_110846, partial [Lottia gigantea]